MRIDKLFLLRFMRSYYRVTKRVDRDFYSVSFAVLNSDISFLINDAII